MDPFLYNKIHLMMGTYKIMDHSSQIIDDMVETLHSLGHHDWAHRIALSAAQCGSKDFQRPLPRNASAPATKFEQFLATEGWPTEEEEHRRYPFCS